MAGIAMGANHGVARRAIVHGVKVLDSRGQGSYSTIISGLGWCVFPLPLASPTFCVPYLDTGILILLSLYMVLSVLVWGTACNSAWSQGAGLPGTGVLPDYLRPWMVCAYVCARGDHVFLGELTPTN